MARPRVAIIGGGPAGLMAAHTAASFAEVDLYEANKAVGRKFLVAGQGGFNLTNHRDGEDLRMQYTPAGLLDEALQAFGSAVFRAWLEDLGVGTYVGSSGRVFPLRGTKPVAVLQAILRALQARGVRTHVEHRFVGFDSHARPLIEHAGDRSVPAADAYLFALGGASWPVTGSTGHWREAFDHLGVATAPFRASNCGVHVPWPTAFAAAHAGKPLKNITIRAGERTFAGEATITEHGLEGNAIYPAVPALRAALERTGTALLHLDLKPGRTAEALHPLLIDAPSKRWVELLRLDRAQTALLKAFTTREEFFDAGQLVRALKALPLSVTALRPVTEAISTVGGIAPDQLDRGFALKGQPHLITVGEMVDWDTPTGGFLLQGCFAMGHHAALALRDRLA